MIEQFQALRGAAGLALLLGFSPLALYWQTAQADQPAEDAINHVVLVWFKAEHRNSKFLDDIMRATRKLKNIDVVKALRVGKSIASDRPTVDDSFDMGIWLLFDNTADRDTYVADPLHVDYLKQSIEGKVEKVLIYDF